MPVNADRILPVVRVGEIPSDELTERWLVERLWCANSVGVIGGAPKCAKTWLGLDMALSVATGTPCLGKYAVPEPRPVLVYQERAIRRGAGVARAGWPDRPHVYRLALSLLRIGEYRSVPHPQKGNGTILPRRNRASIIVIRSLSIIVITLTNHGSKSFF